MKHHLVACIICVYAALSSCAQTKQDSTKSNPAVDGASSTSKKQTINMDDKNLDTITLGAGCFWCVEAVFQSVKGVQSVMSGYSGGHVVNPTYQEICGKQTGHAEVCQVVYDTSKIQLAKLLEIYFLTHDPTTLNQQGADKGPQYRSVIFYHSEQQKVEAQRIKEALDNSGAYSVPIVTAIEGFTNFYPAEEEHRNFYKRNPNYGYCYYVIKPKMDKFEKAFKEFVKE
jgi:peptide-methionine (S)-S-oxide reductase